MRRFKRQDNRTGKVLLVTGDREWPARFNRALEYEIELDISHAESPDDPDVMGQISASDAPVVVIGPGYPRAEGVALARTLSERQPDVSVVLIADSSPGLLQEAVHAGVRDVLDPSTSDIVLRGSLTLAIETAGNRRRLGDAPGARC